MIKYSIKIALLLLALIIIPCVSWAQTEGEDVDEAIEEPVIRTPVASAGEDVEQLAGLKVKFDASKSSNPLDTNMRYKWDFGDGQFTEGEKANHNYEVSGDYKVILTVSNGEAEDTDELFVKIYDDSIMLITDINAGDDEVLSLIRYSSRQRVKLGVISNASTDPDYLVEASLVDSMLERREEVKKSSAIIVWTSGSQGLNVLSKFAQSVGDIVDIEMSSKAIINVVDGNFAPTARLAQSAFDVLQPEYILLTKNTALHTVIEAKYAGEILKEIRSSGITHNLISFYSGRGVKELGVMRLRCWR